MFMPMANCRRLFRQEMRLPFSFARARAGNNIAAKIPIMAMTTSSSMIVNEGVRNVRHNLCGRFLLGEDVVTTRLVRSENETWLKARPPSGECVDTPFGLGRLRDRYRRWREVSELPRAAHRCKHSARHYPSR